MTLFEKLRELRKENKFSLRYVAKELGVSHVTVSDYEKGNRTPTNRRLDQMSELYGCDLSEFKRPEPIVWHPYPQEKPTEKNGYVVSVVDESNGYCFTDTSFYHPNLDRFEMDDVYQLHVYAWAEHPKPYKEVDG